MFKVTMWRTRWRCATKPAYSVSFLLSINIFRWQNVFYFLIDLRISHASQKTTDSIHDVYVKSLSKREHNTAWCSRRLVWGPAMDGVLTRTKYATTNIFSALYILFWRCGPTRAFASSFTRFLQITHHDAPQSVGLLWTSDQLVAETSTWQNTTLTTDRHSWRQRDSNPQNSAGEGPETHALHRTANGTGFYALYSLLNTWRGARKNGMWTVIQ